MAWEEQQYVRAKFGELQQERNGRADEAAHDSERGIRVSCCSKTWRFGCVRYPLQAVRKHGLSRSTANDAEQRGCRRCRAGVVSTGLYSSQEFQRRFPVFNVAVAHCHQCCPYETAQETPPMGCVAG